MKEKLAEALVNVLKIKSIVTLLTTVTFVILSLRGVIEAGQFLTIFTVIIGFYFGTQKVKENEGELTEAETFKTAESKGYFAVPDSDTPFISGITYDATYKPDGEHQQ